MSLYKHLLLATDLTDAFTTKYEKAIYLAESFKAKITLLHVIKKTNLTTLGSKNLNKKLIEIETGLFKRAHIKLLRIGEAFIIPRGDQIITFAHDVAHSIISQAQERAVDLLLLGGDEWPGSGADKADRSFDVMFL
jgi:universal stress protein A